MVAVHDREDSPEAEYERLFHALAGLAADLGVPPGEAEELIDSVIVSALVNRHTGDIDTWVAAAFTSAVTHRGGRTS
jgi:hypothetical protein